MGATAPIIVLTKNVVWFMASAKSRLCMYLHMFDKKQRWTVLVGKYRSYLSTK